MCENTEPFPKPSLPTPALPALGRGLKVHFLTMFLKDVDSGWEFVFFAICILLPLLDLLIHPQEDFCLFLALIY